MADPFKLQQRLRRQLLSDRPSIRDGMALVQRALEKEDGAWKACRGIHWERGLTRWVAWLNALVKTAPPPKGGLGLVWFETPSELNPAMTSVSGWTVVGPASESFGAERQRVWPLADTASTLLEGLHDQPELEEAMERAGWRDHRGEAAEDGIEAGVFALCSCYTLLLVLNGLPRCSLARQAIPMGVCAGWAEGDIEKVGGLVKGRWSKFPRATPSQPKPLSQLEMEDLARFWPLKFLAAGGSADYRDRYTGGSLLHHAVLCDAREIERLIDAGVDVNATDNTGDTVLHAMWSSSAGVVQAIIEAGADVNARAADGCTVLQRFGASELPVLRRLVDAGADPLAVNPRGWTLLDVAMEDGRCTIAHLRYLTSLGIQPAIVSPLHSLAADNVYESARLGQIKQMLGFWLRQDEDINRPCPAGLTPLWHALRAHAVELAEHQSWLKNNRDIGGDWDYSHDRVAELLLSKGANANARFTGVHPLIPPGATPLMVRRYDDARLVKSLLAAGADPLAVSAEGSTALDYARIAAKTPQEVGHKGALSVVQILERVTKRAQAGAKPPKERARSARFRRSNR